jgi:molecular chaperone GrpE
MRERTKPARPDEEDAASVFGELESLRNRLEAAERERDEYLALLQRTRADFENYQKRIQRDLAQERRYSYFGLARDLLLILDNLQRTLDAAQQQKEKSPLVEGVSLLRSQLLDIFSHFGIVPIDAAGRVFDPNLHEAVLQKPRADVPPGTVIQVLESGYRLHERILRPAKVVVSALPRQPHEETSP